MIDITITWLLSIGASKCKQLNEDDERGWADTRPAPTGLLRVPIVWIMLTMTDEGVNPYVAYIGKRPLPCGVGHLCDVIIQHC